MNKVSMKTRKYLFPALLLLILWIGGCRQTTPIPAGTDPAVESSRAAPFSNMEETGHTIVDNQEEMGNGLSGASIDDGESFADTASLQFGRMMFLNHLVEAEGISDIPALFEWQPDMLEKKDDRQEYLYFSGEWRLLLVELDRPSNPDLLYRVRLNGPGVVYGADILRNGQINPAQ
jgi:hypothetical protein